MTDDPANAEDAGRGPQRTRLSAIHLDSVSIGRAAPDIEHERAVAIYDLLEDNVFEVVGHEGGPFQLTLSVVENRLVLDIRSEEDRPVATHVLSLTPFRKVVKDYFLICDSYHEAIRTGSPARIEAIDMGRRGVHDEGSRLLTERLNGKVVLSFDTARRLFTLVAALHWRG